jgi:HK97 family phage major capsid protein
MIVDNIEERCTMRKICSVQEISSISLDVIDHSAMTPSWLGETGTVGDTDTSIFSKKTILTHDLVAQPKVSQKLLDDAAIDLEEWLANRLGNDFAGAEENAFINGLGNGSNQPTGILSYVGETSGIEAVVVSHNSKRFTENDIIDLYYSLGDSYINRASFLMPRSAMKQIRTLKDATSGQYLWNPALLAGQSDTLLGCPIYQSSYMPALGQSTKSILFGDFKHYQIVDRIGIRILRDPFTAKPYVRFYTTKRVGGDVIDMEAFKGLITASFGG